MGDNHKRRRKPSTVCAWCGSTTNPISGGRTYCNVCRNGNLASKAVNTPQDPTNEEWYKRAACLGLDPEIFFNGTSYKVAKKICAKCPVSSDCLDASIREEATLWPLGYRLLYGYRGGVTASNRLPLVSKQAQANKTYRKRLGKSASCHPQKAEAKYGLCAVCLAQYERVTNSVLTYT